MKLVEIIMIIILAFSLTMSKVSDTSNKEDGVKQLIKIDKPDSEWKNELSKTDYGIMRLERDEQAYSGIFYDHFEKGTYHCKGCNNLLFKSTDKFKNGNGYATFNSAINNLNILVKRRIIKGEYKTQVKCSLCDAHLGYVEKDGPPPGGLRFMINSASLTFNKSQ